FDGQVATFTSSHPSDTAASFTATIDWGDGTAPSVGTISAGNGAFVVSGDGTHTYADEGNYTAKVTVVRAADNSTGANSGTITVGEGDALTSYQAQRLTAFPFPLAFTGTVAKFTDTDTLSPPSDFTAMIDWGDGTTSTGLVSGGNGAFAVSGTHSYSTPGP